MTGQRREHAVRAIRSARAVAIIRARSGPDAVAIGEAIIEAGLRVVEVASTTPGALDAIARLAKNPQVLVGAGTILDIDSARDAVRAGARFLVSPGVDDRVVRESALLDVASLPGAATATEVHHARALGADFIKLFPASSYGIGHLTALLTVFPDVAFLPTGGIAPDNARAWLEAGAVAVGVGGSLTRDPSAVRARASALLAALDVRSRGPDEVPEEAQ